MGGPEEGDGVERFGGSALTDVLERSGLDRKPRLGC